MIDRAVVETNGAVKLFAVNYSLGMDKSLVALIDADYLNTAGNCCARYRANGCVHAGSVAARGQNAYLSEFRHYTRLLTVLSYLTIFILQKCDFFKSFFENLQ